MKLIKLRTGDFATTDIIKTVMERAPQGGIGVDDMRARCRVLDAIDACVAGGGTAPLVLEDNDHATLTSAIKTFPFGMASKDLLGVIDDVLNAEAPPAPAAAAAADGTAAPA